jgi:pteridine reductase
MESSTDLAGRAVLITGAARRVGAAIARLLHAHGANLVIHYRSSAKDAEALRSALEAKRRGSATLVQADLADPQSYARVVGEAAQAFGRLDVLVNNASSFYPTPVGEITEKHWHDLVGSNLKAPLFLSQAAAPHLREAGGLILNLVDIHAARPLRRHTVYSIAKGGLVILTRSLARELAPEVRVNAIAPGPVMWPEHGADDELRREIIERTALKRMGSPDDIARTALFFVRDAPFVTGQVLAVDGGRSIGW